MHSVVVYHRGWVITCRSHIVESINGQAMYGATAVLGTLRGTPSEAEQAQAVGFRRVFTVKGAFTSESLAIDSALAIAKSAIDALLP
jgi:hypothetical protein